MRFGLAALACFAVALCVPELQVEPLLYPPATKSQPRLNNRGTPMTQLVLSDKLASFSSFVVDGVAFFVPHSNPATKRHDDEVAALQMQLDAMGTIVELDEVALNRSAAAVLWPSFLLTKKSAGTRIHEVALAARRALAYVTAGPAHSCITYRTGYQYSAAQIIIGRVLEYAGQQAGINDRMRSNADPLRAFQAPLASHFRAFVPLDLSLILSISRAEEFVAMSLRVVNELGLDPQSLVFVNSRVTRDLLVEDVYVNVTRLILTHPILSKATFVSEEGYPRWAWGWVSRRNVPGDVPFVDQVDVPYTSALHAESHCSSRPWPFPLRVRPIRIVLVSGPRQDNYMRTVIMRHVESCANSTTLPEGSCAFLSLGNSQQGSSSDVPHFTLGLYGSSVFCVQPPGDTPLRRAVYDSMQMGCIPVMLRQTRIGPRENEPWHHARSWHFANDLAVDYKKAFAPVMAIPDKDFESGAFLPFLLGLNGSVVAKMQAELRGIVFSTQYREPSSTCQHPQPSGCHDAVDVLLSVLATGGVNTR